MRSPSFPIGSTLSIATRSCFNAPRLRLLSEFTCRGALRSTRVYTRC